MVADCVWVCNDQADWRTYVDNVNFPVLSDGPHRQCGRDLREAPPAQLARERPGERGQPRGHNGRCDAQHGEALAKDGAQSGKDSDGERRLVDVVYRLLRDTDHSQPSHDEMGSSREPCVHVAA